MAPSTPSKSHNRTSSQFSTPATPETAYVLAQESQEGEDNEDGEETPTERAGSLTTPIAFDVQSGPNRDQSSHFPPREEEDDHTPMVFDLKHPDTPAEGSRSASTSRRNSQDALGRGSAANGITSAGGSASSASGSGTGSGSSYESELLEMLENDDEATDFELNEDELEEALGSDAAEPLVGRGRRRRRRKWDDEEENKDRSLFEVSCPIYQLWVQRANGQLIPPLILAHPLPLLPLLALLPYNFLPAGVVFFIPIICVLTVLSSCAHIVIVYLSW